MEGEVFTQAWVAYFCLLAKLILKPKGLPPNGSFPTAVQPGATGPGIFPVTHLVVRFLNKWLYIPGWF